MWTQSTAVRTSWKMDLNDMNNCPRLTPVCSLKEIQILDFSGVIVIPETQTETQTFNNSVIINNSVTYLMYSLDEFTK